MAIISASNIIRSLAIFHLIIAYFLLFSPQTIGTHTVVVILSASFGLPYNPPSLQEPSALTALLAVVLVYFSVSDLLAASMHEEIASLYWSAQAPFRALFFFVLTTMSLFLRPGGLAGLASSSDAMRQAALLSAAGGGVAEKGVANGVVFTWAILGVLSWFWIYVSLRDERSSLQARRAATRLD